MLRLVWRPMSQPCPFQRGIPDTVTHIVAMQRTTNLIRENKHPVSGLEMRPQGVLAVYLPTADKYPRHTHRPVIGTKRPSRGSSHSLLAALSPLCTPATLAVSTPVACAGHLPVLFPPCPAGSHPCGLRPRWHAEPPHLAQRPAPIRSPRRHGWRTRPPRPGCATTVGGRRLGQRSASGRMGQAQRGVGVVHSQMLA
jgi:hypothetical protein